MKTKKKPAKNQTKQTAKHTSDLPLDIKRKLSDIETAYFLNELPATIDVNAPRALLQAFGEGKSQGIRWTLALPLYKAAPDLLEAAKRGVMALTANGAPNCEAAKELSAAITKAEGK